MPKKLRHSKFRNTGILFELLTRQITVDIIAGNDDSVAKTLLFKYFKENTELGKELRLYKLLLHEKINDETHAERFVSVILEQRKKLSNSKLSKEKYDLIKEIKETYPIDDFLKASMKNYRALASIYKLFEDAASKEINFPVKEIYQAKSCIIENIVDKPRVSATSDETIKLYEQQSEEIRLLAYRMLVDGVNSKYQTLDENQKLILREYINSISNTNSFGKFIVERVNDIKKQLSEVISQVDDSEVVQIKINEVVKQLNKIKPDKIVRDNHVMVVLLSYELLKEIKSQLSKESSK
jgi:hypothetical protein